MKKKPSRARKLSKIKKLSKNHWAISTIVLAVLLIAISLTGSTTGAIISAETAGQKLLAFAESRGASATLVSATDSGSLYEVVLLIDGQEVPLYVRKDGKSLVPQLIPLETTGTQTAPPAPSAPTPTTVPKSNKPQVMSR